MGLSVITQDGTEQRNVTLYLVRHGKTILNALGRVQGWADATLTPAGTEKVTAAGLGLKDIPFQNIYSSDSGRAIRTAEIIAAQNQASPGLEVQTDYRLREFNFGSYEGEYSRVMHEDIAAANNLDLKGFRRLRTPRMIADTISQLDVERRGKNKQTWPAENYRTVCRRLTEAVDSIITEETKRGGSGNVLVVSHGLSIATILAIADGDKRHDLPDGLENTSVSTIVCRNGQCAVEKINSMGYTEAGEKMKETSQEL